METTFVGSDSIGNCGKNGSQEMKEFRENSSQLSDNIETPAYSKSTYNCCRAYKNLLGISFSFFLVFGVYIAELSLQSSINEDGGLGLASLSIVYFSFLVSCLFSAALINFFGTKYTIVIAYCGMTAYTISNFYASWYTLIPGSVLIGLIFGPLWASHGVHITHIAHQYALKIKKKPQQIVFFFFGLYVFIFKMSYVPSNIVSSVVLLNGRSPNTSVVDNSLGEICNNTEAANLDRVYVYVLLSIYIVLDVMGVVLVLVLVDHIPTETQFLSISNVLSAYIKTPVINTLKLLLSWKINMVAIMMVMDGYCLSFVFGVFSKVFVSDCIGVYWIGFCQSAFGTASATSAILNGYLAKLVPQYILVYIGAIINAGIAVFLLVWQRQPSYLVVFFVLFCWGYSEGIWNSVPPSLVGTVLSHKDKEAAHSCVRMWNAVGFIIGFVCAIVLSVEAMLWINLALLFVTLISYSVLIFVTQPIHRLLPCCFRKQ